MHPADFLDIKGADDKGENIPTLFSNSYQQQPNHKYLYAEEMEER